MQPSLHQRRRKPELQRRASLHLGGCDAELRRARRVGLEEPGVLSVPRKDPHRKRGVAEEVLPGNREDDGETTVSRAFLTGLARARPGRRLGMSIEGEHGRLVAPRRAVEETPSGALMCSILGRRAACPRAPPPRPSPRAGGVCLAYVAALLVALATGMGAPWPQPPPRRGARRRRRHAGGLRLQRPARQLERLRSVLERGANPHHGVLGQRHALGPGRPRHRRLRPRRGVGRPAHRELGGALARTRGRGLPLRRDPGEDRTALLAGEPRRHPPPSDRVGSSSGSSRRGQRSWATDDLRGCSMPSPWP